MTTERNLNAYQEFLTRYVRDGQPLSASDYVTMLDLAFHLALGSENMTSS